MAEISRIASTRLARLRQDFLSLTPEAAEAFIIQLRQRRARPIPTKKVQNVKVEKPKKVKTVKVKTTEGEAQS